MKKQTENITEDQTKPKRELTMKQENFCREYILCGNASEAYRRAYDSENMKPETIHNKASAYLKYDEIRARIEELKNSLEELLGINKATEIKELIRIRERCMKPMPKMIWVKDERGKPELVQKEDENGDLVFEFDSSGANSAQDKIFKAMGYYAPQKGELSGPDGKPIQTQSTISQLDSEKLKNLDPEKLLALKKAVDIQNELLANG